MLFMHHCSYQLNQFQSLFDSINPIHIDVCFILRQQFLLLNPVFFFSLIHINSHHDQNLQNGQWCKHDAKPTRKAPRRASHVMCAGHNAWPVAHEAYEKVPPGASACLPNVFLRKNIIKTKQSPSGSCSSCSPAAHAGPKWTYRVITPRSNICQMGMVRIWQEKQASRSSRMNSMMWCASRTHSKSPLRSPQHSWQTISCLAFRHGTQKCFGCMTIFLSLKPTWADWWTTSWSCSPASFMRWSQLMALTHWQQKLIAHKQFGRSTRHSRLAWMITDMWMKTWHQCTICTQSNVCSR